MGSNNQRYVPLIPSSGTSLGRSNSSNRSPAHRRPLKANGYTEGGIEDHEGGPADSSTGRHDAVAYPDRQLPELSGKLATIFTRNALRSGPAEWRALHASAADLMTAEDDKLILELRRKAMSCVYAERARKKRMGKMKDVTGRVGELQKRNVHLENENTVLREELAVLKAQISSFSASPVHAHWLASTQKAL